MAQGQNSKASVSIVLNSPHEQIDLQGLLSITTYNCTEYGTCNLTQSFADRSLICYFKDHLKVKIRCDKGILNLKDYGERKMKV